MSDLDRRLRDLRRATEGKVVPSPGLAARIKEATGEDERRLEALAPRPAMRNIHAAPEVDRRVAEVVANQRIVTPRWVVLIAAAAAVLVGMTATLLGPLRHAGRTRVAVTWSAEDNVVGSWESMNAGPLAGRAEPKAVWTGTEMLVVGGLDVERYGAFADGASYDPSSDTWRRIADRPDRGRIMVVAWTGSELFALGQQEGIDLDDMRSSHLYDPRSNTWRPTSPPPRGFDAPIGAWWTGQEILVWQLGRGMLYDPSSDQWRDIPAIDVPGAGALGRAVWLDGAQLLAVQGATAPPDGGQLRDALFLFEPANGRWRVAAPAPDKIPFFTSAQGAWLGSELVFNPDPRGGTYAYHPTSDTWRELPTPAVTRDRGTGYFHGVPLGESGGAIRIGDSRHPLLFVGSAGGWSYSSAPDGKVPGPKGVVLWTGRQVILWGRPDEVGPELANAAWKWTPRAP